MKKFDHDIVLRMAEELLFPVYYITICQLVLFGEVEFVEDYHSMSTWVLGRAREMSKFWRSEYGIDIDSVNIDFSGFYSGVIYKDDDDEPLKGVCV